MINFWDHPAVIAPNKFVYKSLSDWSYNVAVGCNHACRFCYVPSASTIRMGGPTGMLTAKGVTDPDEQWGDYVFVRKFDQAKFIQSLASAHHTKKDKLSRDGNRAVMLCTTTDPFQVLSHPNADLRKLYNATINETVVNGLYHINRDSSLNVRILTRSPLAANFFGNMQEFAPKRLLFGMSLPTLNDKLARIYEPKAPSPTQRLKCLREAKEAGLNVYVAMAPAYPECDAADLERTMRAILELDPMTIFFEPINIRADNVARIEAHAATLGVTVKTDVFRTTETWRRYAFAQLRTVEDIARRIGAIQRLHLWPDQSLGSKDAIKQLGKENPAAYTEWLNRWWYRVSEWPK